MAIAFGHQFAHHNQQITVHEEADADGDAALCFQRRDFEQVKKRTEQVPKYRLDRPRRRAMLTRVMPNCVALI